VRSEQVADLRVGIVGLGNIGRAVADDLRASGIQATAVRRPSSADFPRLVANAGELARTSDIVVAALASEEAMRAAYLARPGRRTSCSRT
jgi:phosphoglycerate dehydrogenase-like enzyme